MPKESEPKTEKPETEAEKKNRERRERIEKKIADLERDIATQKERNKKLEEAGKEVAEKDEKGEWQIKTTDPKLRKDIEEALKRRKEAEKEFKEAETEQEGKKREAEDKRNDLEMNVQVAVGKMNPKLFTETTPKRKFFDQNFMRYINGAQYMALMASERISEDEKKKATEARFGFCYDMLESDGMKEYYGKKEAYEEAYDKWMEELNDNPYAIPPKAVQDGKPDFPINTDLGKAVHQKFRNGIRNLKEVEIIHNYMPQLFEQPEFVMSIRMEMIGQIRKSETFGEIRGKFIREKKVQDFMDIIDFLEKKKIFGGDSSKNSKKYFKDFTDAQLRELRKRMFKARSGKNPEEMSSLGSRAWKSPITMDIIDQSVIRGFSKSDPSDIELIIKHLLLALSAGKLSDENRGALKFIRGHKVGHGIYALSDGAVEKLAKEAGIDIEKIREPLGLGEIKTAEFAYGDK